MNWRSPFQPKISHIVNPEPLDHASDAKLMSPLSIVNVEELGKYFVVHFQLHVVRR